MRANSSERAHSSSIAARSPSFLFSLYLAEKKIFVLVIPLLIFFSARYRENKNEGLRAAIEEE
jgi:heme/copper-type cytochrome/quinol oxidase subunit 2